ncbi:MAG: hypothetical protein H5U22_08410 [Rhizobium sp.]|nr:hypothetical protein [Rhizobium sp.]
MSNLRSKAALLEFLEYLARKGLMNKTTAASRKAAVNNVLSILDDDEAADVSKIDLDDVMRRFSNLNGLKYTSDSLTTYKSRVRSALDDFLSYLDNPMAFRPSTGGAVRKGQERGRVASVDTRKRITATSNFVSEQGPELPPPAIATLVLPIPVRADLTVYIQGLPFDLTQAEASKIANVIRAMAVGE